MCGNNWIGYVIHHASPGPMLAVQPTVELAKRVFGWRRWRARRMWT